MVFIYISTIILTCLLGVLVYITTLKGCKNNLVAFFLTLLTIYLLKDFIAARAQLVTFSLFVLTILFIESFLESKKKRYLIYLVIISIIIANIHVAVWPFFFVLFLPYIAEYIIAFIIDKNILSKILIFSKKQKVEKIEKLLNNAKDEKEINKLKLKLDIAKNKLLNQQEKEQRIIEKRKKRKENPYRIRIVKNDSVKWLILVMAICALTGLITPIGDAPYTYLVKTMQGNTTKSISEHLPLTLFNEKDTMFVLAFIFVILIFTDVKIRLSDLFMVGGLVLLSFMSRRQVSLLLILGVVSLSRWIEYLLCKYDKDGSIDFMDLMTTNIGKIITIAFVVLVSIAIIKPKLNDKFIIESKYPVDAATWMLENLDVQNIKLYNEYNYGSYLLFRGIPVFIDSRADLYAPEFNTKEGEEKRDIFSDYINVSTIGTYYETKFEKYEITHVIVVNNAKLNMFLSRDDDYKELYKDDNFVIYERNK